MKQKQNGYSSAPFLWLVWRIWVERNRYTGQMSRIPAHGNSSRRWFFWKSIAYNTPFTLHLVILFIHPFSHIFRNYSVDYLRHPVAVQHLKSQSVIDVNVQVLRRIRHHRYSHHPLLLLVQRQFWSSKIPWRHCIHLTQTQWKKVRQNYHK